MSLLISYAVVIDISIPITPYLQKKQRLSPI